MFMLKGIAMVIKNKQRLLLICLIMMMSVMFAGCGGEQTEDSSSAEAETVITCNISVDDFCSDKVIEINEGESVYDALEASGADISARKSTHGLYVEGINGRFEFDEGPSSGWVYTVNEERPSVSCDEYEVEADDKIVWEYVISYEE